MMRTKPISVWFFGKPYHWWVIDGVLTLAPDRQLPLLMPRTTARGAKTSWARVEHKFRPPQGKSMLAAYARQAALYAGMMSPACSRCGAPAPPYESIEIDPLCSDCVMALSYSELWRKIDQGQ